MNPLSNEQKQDLVAKAVEWQWKMQAEPITGRATDLTCTCGGVLHEREIPPPPRILPGPRRSRNRRIRKKQRLKWMRTTGRALLYIHMAMMALRPTGYRCASCKRHMGFYEAVGRNIFQIEPLPDGALPIYDRDPEVASIVVPGGAGVVPLRRTS